MWEDNRDGTRAFVSSQANKLIDRGFFKVFGLVVVNFGGTA